MTAEPVTHAPEPTTCRCDCQHPSEDPMLPRAFTEGRTFDERKAATVAPNTQPRLVSLGPSEYVQRNKSGDLEVLNVELFCDVDRRTDFYVRLPGESQLIRLADSDQRRDAVTVLAPLPAGQRRFSRPESGRNPSPPDPAPVPIGGSENPLFTPRP